MDLVGSFGDEPFPYLEVIIWFYLIAFLFETYLDYRQHKNFSILQKPSHLEGYITDEKFLKGQNYKHAQSTFSFIKTTYSMVETLLMFYYFALPLVWGWSQKIVTDTFGLDPQNEIVISLVFLGIYQLYEYTHLPFELYSTFVIEEKFGFNKQTLFLFFTDKIKTFGLSLVLGVPVIVIVLKVIEYGGENFWFWLWVFLLAFQFLMLTIYPIWIAPLFNTFKPLEEGELREKINALANRLEFPLTKLFVIDGSARSSHSNAYFYGLFKNKRIVLYDTLMTQVDTDGIVAILGHEMGHWKENHTIKNLVIGQAQIFFYLYTYSLFMNNTDMYRSFGFDTQPRLIGLILFSLVYEPLGHLFGFAMNVLSRHFEYEADRFATNLGYDLSVPLIKIHVENLSAFYPDPWYSAYHHSHPTLSERLRAIEEVKKKE